MYKIALIQNGTVQNVCLWDGIKEFATPGLEKVTLMGGSTVSSGDLYQNGVFTQAPQQQTEEE